MQDQRRRVLRARPRPSSPAGPRDLVCSASMSRDSSQPPTNSGGAAEPLRRRRCRRRSASRRGRARPSASSVGARPKARKPRVSRSEPATSRNASARRLSRSAWRVGGRALLGLLQALLGVLDRGSLSSARVELVGRDRLADQHHRAGWRRPAASPRPGPQRLVSPSDMCRRSSVGLQPRQHRHVVGEDADLADRGAVESCSTSPSKTSPSGVRTCAWRVCSRRPSA